MVQKETGWTDDYVLWGVSYASLQLRIADAPRYHYGESKQVKMLNERELVKFLEKNK